MMTWCSFNVNTNAVMPPYSYMAQMECKCSDVMVMWVASNANLVTSQWACMSHMCVHGTCAIITMGMLNYLNSLMGMPADSNLKKLTTSHFSVQITQNANENMPNMFPILYLNENLRYCDENLAWGKLESLVHLYVFKCTTKGEEVAKTPFYFIYLYI